MKADRNCNWQKLVLKIFLWLFIEALLNLTGTDDLADYSEFLNISQITWQSQYTITT